MFLRGGDFGDSGELLLLLVPILGAGDTRGSVENSLLLFHSVSSYHSL